MRGMKFSSQYEKVRTIHSCDSTNYHAKSAIGRERKEKKRKKEEKSQGKNQKQALCNEKYFSKPLLE